jgi:septal ring factor EnvC (AmiA/AmiB activator)
VSDVSSDPAVDQWRAALGQSTSAQLRETQAALAASQADLTSARESNEELRAELEIAERERDGARAAAEEFWRQRDKARTERDAIGQICQQQLAEIEGLRAGQDRCDGDERRLP